MTLILWKIWGWLKMNWKWILFPVGLLMSIGGVLIAIRNRENVHITELAVDNAWDLFGEEDSARTIKDAKLEELKREHQSRLEKLSEDQRRELSELESKSTEEITQWFDKL